MGKVRDVLGAFVPSVTVFLLGGVIMALGLVVARLVAGSLGASLYTWTSIVGIGLGAMAFGSYAGGRVTDRYHPRRVLAVLFGLSSAACVAVIVLNTLVDRWLWLWGLSWPVHTFVHAAFLLFVPLLLLGAIVPVTAAMTAGRVPIFGRAAGSLCAWGAAGAVAGTFATGFYLIPAYGCIAMIWLIGATLLGIALLYWTSCWALYLWAMVFATLAAMGMAPAEWAREAGEGAALREASDPSLLYERETTYSHLAVRRVSDRPDRRAFWQDSRRRGEIVVGETTRLHQFHTEVCAGLTRGLAADRSDPSMLVIGSGGYAFPRYLTASWPQGVVRVIEIDPGVTRAAREAFDLEEESAIEIVHVDARYHVEFLANRRDASDPEGPYDFIYVDMVRDGTIPVPLVTQQFNERIATLLADDGVYMVHVIDAPGGGRFLGAVVATLEQTFAHVCVVADRVGPRATWSAFVVVAAQRAFDAAGYLRDFDEYLEFERFDEPQLAALRAVGGHLVLTDDYAPVEALLASVTPEVARQRLAHRSFREAGRLRIAQQYERSALRYCQAAELSPSMATEAWSRVGEMRLAQEDLQGAAEAFQNAVAQANEAGRQTMAIATAQMNLGIVLGQMGRNTDARTHLAEAAGWFRVDLRKNPNSVVCWERLGDTLVLAGDLEGAAEAFDRAMALEPDNLAFYEKLAQTLERQQRYDQAIAVARKHVAMLKKLGRRDIALQVGAYVDFLEYQRVKQRR